MTALRRMLEDEIPTMPYIINPRFLAEKVVYDSDMWECQGKRGVLVLGRIETGGRLLCGLMQVAIPLHAQVMTHTSTCPSWP